MNIWFIKLSNNTLAKTVIKVSKYNFLKNNKHAAPVPFDMVYSLYTL